MVCIVCNGPATHLHDVPWLEAVCEGWVRRRPAAQAQVRRRRRAPVPELMVSTQFLMMLCVLCMYCVCTHQAQEAACPLNILSLS